MGGVGWVYILAMTSLVLLRVSVCLSALGALEPCNIMVVARHKVQYSKAGRESRWVGGRGAAVMYLSGSCVCCCFLGTL